MNQMMSKNSMRFCAPALFGLGLGLIAATAAPMQAGAGNEATKAEHEESSSVTEDETKRVEMSADVLKDALTGEDAAIPEALLKEAHGIVVIPHVVKGGLLVGGQYGKGLAAWRTEDGTWSTPMFVGMGGATYGFQAGVETVDLILVITEKDGLKALLEDGLKLGAGIGVTAGPIGRNAEAGVNLTLDSGVYSYSRAKGLFAGATLEGAVVTLDSGANEDVYGQKMTSDDFMTNPPKVKMSPVVEPFTNTLNQHVPELES